MRTFRIACTAVVSYAVLIAFVVCVGLKTTLKAKAAPQQCVACSPTCGNLTVRVTPINDPCWPNLQNVEADFDWTCTGDGAIGCRWTAYAEISQRNLATDCIWEFVEDYWANNGSGDTFESGGCPTRGTQNIFLGEFDLDPAYDWQIIVTIYPTSLTDAQNGASPCKVSTYTIDNQGNGCP